MKLTISGSGSGKPASEKNHSSIIVEKANEMLLIDCGEPIARVFAEKEILADALDYLVISHFHPDHSSGIYMLLQLFHIQKRKKTLKIFLPENIEAFRQSLSMFYLFEERLGFDLKFFTVEEINNHIPWLKAIKSNHLKSYRDVIDKNNYHNKMLSYSFIIQGKKQVLFTSDITTTKHLKEQIQESDIIILDALHPSPAEIEKLLSLEKHIVLNHGLHPELTKHYSTQKLQGGEFAKDGLEIYI